MSEQEQGEDPLAFMTDADREALRKADADVKSITASGGWCAPNAVIFDVGVPTIDVVDLFREWTPEEKAAHEAEQAEKAAARDWLTKRLMMAVPVSGNRGVEPLLRGIVQLHHHNGHGSCVSCEGEWIDWPCETAWLVGHWTGWLPELNLELHDSTIDALVAAWKDQTR